MITTPKLDRLDLWRASYRGLQIEIKRFDSVLKEHWDDCWTYYVYIPEHLCPNFAALWLEDKLFKFTPESPGRINHDYYESPLGSVDMHGGITWYSKHGHTEGHRCVQIGCDYQHYWDEGHTYTAESVLHDVMQTVDDLVERGLVVEKSS